MHGIAYEVSKARFEDLQAAAMHEHLARAVRGRRGVRVALGDVLITAGRRLAEPRPARAAHA